MKPSDPRPGHNSYPVAAGIMTHRPEGLCPFPVKKNTYQEHCEHMARDHKSTNTG